MLMMCNWWKCNASTNLQSSIALLDRWKAPSQTRELFVSSGNYGEFGQILFDEAFSQDAIYDAANQVEVIKNAKSFFDMDKDLAFESQACSETIRLIK